MKYIDLTLENNGGDNAQLFDFKWAENSPGAGWLEANGEWVTNKENAYNRLVQDAQGINSKFVYIYGTPVITDEQVVSGFGNGNYLRTDYVSIPSIVNDTDILEIVTKVTPDNFNNDWNIILRSPDGGGCIAFQKNTGKLSTFINGSWRIGSTSYQNNQTIWLKLTCKKQGTTNINYALYSLIDNNYDLSTLPENDWTSEWSGAYNNFEFIGAHQYDFGYNVDVTTEYLNGSISLNHTRIKFNDKILWLLHYNPRLNDNNFYVVPIKNESDIIETITTSWTQPILSSNGTIGGDDYACTCSSNENNFQAYKAFDNNLTTQWGAISSSTPQSLTFYSPEALKLLSVYLDFKSETEVWASGEIQGSNDNNTWTTLTTFNDNTDVVITLPIETENYYQYIRFYGTSHGGTGWGKIQEMKLSALRVNDYVINKSITLKKTALNFYAILDENNHRFVLPQADYYIPDTDMKLYFYLG